MTDAIVSVSELVKDFGDERALDGVDLTIPRGAIVGVIGPSGCGKTTLVRTLTGTVLRTSGDVAVLGTDPEHFDADHRGRFGYMPQLPVLFPNLTLWGNLSFVSSVYGMSLRGRRHRLRELLELVDLGGDRHKRLADCSGGMQRRLSLASTLVHDPELLFLDEPTAGIDPILRERFWEHFRFLRDQGRTIVVPTQYVGEASLCDLVAVMSDGRILTLQPPELLHRFAFRGDPLSISIDSGWPSRDEVARVATLPFVREVQRTTEGLLIVVEDADRDTEELRRWFETTTVQLGEISGAQPSMDELFVRIIQTDRAEREPVAA